MDTRPPERKNAMQHTARRSFGDNGVPANGNKTTTRTTNGRHDMDRFIEGQKVTLTHPQYGEIRGSVHTLPNAKPYVPVGITHFTLGKRFHQSEWTVIDGWGDTAEARVRALLDGWDLESTEATQADLADAIRAIYDSRT